MPQLIESSARDHGANSCERSIRTNAPRLRCEAEPHSAAALLHAASESAVVDNFAADGFDPTSPIECLRAYEDAAAGCTRGRASRIGNPRRRIKLQEEENKSRDQQALGEDAALQSHHERRKIVVSCLSDGGQSLNAVGSMLNIGIGQQKKVGTKRLRLVDSLFHSPELSRPTRRQRFAVDHG